MQPAIIGLDVGTTNAKAVLFDLAGVERARAECAYGLSVPNPGWAEQDPEEVWQAVCHVLRAVSVDDTVQAIALAVASQSGTLVPARADGTPLYPAITWMDGRSEDIVREWVQQDAGKRIRQITGWHAHPGLPLATLAWLAQGNPDVCTGAERWLGMNDFIVHRLTGTFVTNPSNAGVTQLVDMATRDWSAELCTLASTVITKFSTILDTGARVGFISPAAAELTGLPIDVKVINGGHDQSCTALAMGVTEPGQVLLACGTSWVVTSIAAEPDITSLPDVLDLNYHAVSNRWTVSQSLGGVGASLEWLVNQCWAEVPSRDERYIQLNAAVAGTQPGSDGPLYLPMAGGHLAPAAIQQGGFLNVQLGHIRAHLARAVMEGAAFELALALRVLQASSMRINQLWMVGGATRSSIWPEIVSSVTGLPVRVTESAQLPAVGAAMLAGWGAGLFQSLAEAQACFCVPYRDVIPTIVNQEIYAQSLSRYIAATTTLSTAREL